MIRTAHDRELGSMLAARILSKPVLAGVLAAGAVGGGGLLVASVAHAATTKQVHIKDIDFSPHRLTIKRGTTVKWTFEDQDTPHNVRSRGSKKFTGSQTKQSGSYSFRFTKAGTYNYVCTIHLNMKGKIVVK